MGFELRKGISFCEVSDRLLFLDVMADRYFCLQPAAEHSFRGMLYGGVIDDMQRGGLIGMLRSGTLIETHGHGVPHAFRIHHHASLSLLDAQNAQTSASRITGALSAIMGARLSLRWRGLHAILKSIDLGRIPWPRSGAVDLDAIQETAMAFEKTSRVLRSHDKCLSRSIALARYLAARGLPGDLVIGVRLRPFGAHAWVQSGKWLVNDRIDTVRCYTPIMAV
ncbi:lasso peptide biosynthesis B2 protein [Novosphingobium sp.]|uniref:lasso peptide biosynthesis B2 protein n=1 Tax=Novosphingobium sp. TaxID=1874826 RepID=UPI0031D3C161